MWNDPASQEREWIVKYPHRMVGELGQVGLAFSFSDTPARIQGAPVLVGEHTREILAEVGYAPEEIGGLFEAGAVKDETVYPALAPQGAESPASPWADKS